jgi:hypothetical protein
MWHFLVINKVTAWCVEGLLSVQPAWLSSGQVLPGLVLD